jgi:hypothetical protein
MQGRRGCANIFRNFVGVTSASRGLAKIVRSQGCRHCGVGIGSILCLAELLRLGRCPPARSVSFPTGRGQAGCGAKLASFPPNCLPWVRRCARTVVGSRANEDRIRLRSAGCGRRARPRGRFRTGQFQISNCRLQARRAATGCCALPPVVQEGSRNIAECRIRRRSPRKPRRGVCPLSWQWHGEMFAYVRLCSLMFAFFGKKCLRGRMGARFRRRDADGCDRDGRAPHSLAGDSGGERA